MKIDPASAATVAAIIQSDVQAILKLSGQLEDLQKSLDQPDAGFRDLAAAAYVLHNLYNALENSFEHISRAFENHVKDPAQWHKELLMKMFLDLPGIRPAVLAPSCKNLLHELRGFRHIFRHSYDFEIDQERLLHLLCAWMAGRKTVTDSLTSFQDWLLSTGS